MHIITAFVDGRRFEAVQQTLNELSLEALATQLAEVARREPVVEIWRGSRHTLDRQSVLRLEIPYEGNDADGIVAAVLAAGSFEGSPNGAMAWATEATMTRPQGVTDPSRLLHPAAH